MSRIIEVDLEDPGIERIGERAREMLEAATAPKSYLMQEQTTTPLDMGAVLRNWRAWSGPTNGSTAATGNASPARTGEA